MRRVLTALLALMMLIGSTASIATAQVAGTPEAPDEGAAEATAGGDTSFAKGLDAVATYFSERGDPVATIQVVDVERGWQEYGEYYEPKAGLEYVAVTFEVSSVARGNLVVKPYDLSLIDGIGRNNSRSYVSVDEASSVEILEDDTAVATGETAQLTIVFELFEEAQLGYFMWQPDSGIIIMVDLTEV